MRLVSWVLARVVALKAILAARRDQGRDVVPERPHAAPAPATQRLPMAGDAISGTRGASRSTPPEDAVVDSPMDLGTSDWKATGKRTLAEIKDDRITLAAAGMAYYFFLAIFPAVIAAIGILGLINVDESGMVDVIRRNMPGGSGAVLVDAVQNSDRPAEGAKVAAAVLGIAAALWSASSGMVALQSGLNIAYDVPEDRKFVGKRVVAFMLLVATAVLGGVPSPLFTFGDSLVLSIIGWVVTFVCVIVLFSLFYYLGPNRERPQWKWVSAGGLLGAALWILGSLAFGYYASNFSSYGRTYGPLAGVIILILWLYLSSLAVLVGGELNSELERQAARRSSA
ncbi:MAG TPA: YihY/virulence factor BrkB family protein [Actinomycetota bacterium]|nr:YihY/virulence factor BrkB family protein [Actinomycetota bacterium]